MTAVKPFVIFYHLIQQWVSSLFVFLVKKWKYKTYLFLAAVFSLGIFIDAVFLHVTEKMQHAGFDLTLRYRIFAPKPDEEIIIVDIDEASLASMAKEYGRWPWPRQVLGEFLEHLEVQKPKAVVFDILFSDPDVYNADSDAYFDAVVADTNNTFFPMLRLDAASDPLSQFKPATIPGVAPIPGQAQENATIAVVVPYLQSIVRGGRLGFNNIYPDRDGIVRQYSVYSDDYGWKIPSLAARVVRELGYREPSSPSVLLNWRGKPFSYQTVGFVDVFNDMISKDKKRRSDEFTDKIVLIGSTAPSLFDVKATPMSRLHPGVEIMATAIDNLKRGDYLHSPEGRMLYPLVTLVIVWLIAVAFYRDPGGNYVDRMTGSSQFTLLAVSYASINLTNTYINLIGPFTIGLAYFGVARLYAAASSKALETSVVRTSLKQEIELRAFLLLIRMEESDHSIGESKLKQIRRRLEKSGIEPKSVEILTGHQKGIWSIFENTLAVSWVMPAQDHAARERVIKDVEAVTASLKTTLPPALGSEENGAIWVVHESLIAGGKAARTGWDRMFAETQLRWHQARQQRGRGNMNLSKPVFALLFAWVFAMGTAYAGEAGSALKGAEIRVEPYRDAKQVGSLASGDKVEILSRQGGWYEVKSVKGSGWVHMLSIRRGDPTKRSIDAEGVVGLATGRGGTGQVIATTGIRGLSEEELKKAKFNESELKKVESFTATQKEVRKFAAEGKLVERKVNYLPSRN
jgi:adenylate cyclase